MMGMMHRAKGADLVVIIVYFCCCSGKLLSSSFLYDVVHALGSNAGLWAMYHTMVGILNNAMDPASIEVGLGGVPSFKKNKKSMPWLRNHECLNGQVLNC
jgi:hypothetical protein